MNKNIIFVIGPPNSGKSFYIKNNLSDYYIIDLYNFQKGIPPVPEFILKSYIDCANALTEACKKYNKIVLEHTLLKSKRRPMFINAVKKACGNNFKITCIYMDIDLNTYKELDKANLNEWLKNNKNSSAKLENEKVLLKYINEFEHPTKDEGFDKIIKIKPNLNNL